MLKVIIWNIRSVRTQKTFDRIQILHNHHQFFMIVLLVPFQQTNNMHHYKRRLEMQFAGTNEFGKIWLFVKEDIDVVIVLNTNQ